MATTWTFKPLLGSQAAIDAQPIKQGQFLMKKDGGAVYFDQDNQTRILVANADGGGGGGGTGTGYVHTQTASSDSWVINHNLGFYPNVTVIDSAGTTVIGEVNYDSTNKLTIKFSASFSGKAYLS